MNVWLADFVSSFLVAIGARTVDAKRGLKVKGQHGLGWVSGQLRTTVHKYKGM